LFINSEITDQTNSKRLVENIVEEHKEKLVVEFFMSQQSRAIKNSFFDKVNR